MEFIFCLTVWVVALGTLGLTNVSRVSSACFLAFLFLFSLFFVCQSTGRSFHLCINSEKNSCSLKGSIISVCKKSKHKPSVSQATTTPKSFYIISSSSLNHPLFTNINVKNTVTYRRIIRSFTSAFFRRLWTSLSMTSDPFKHCARVTQRTIPRPWRSVSSFTRPFLYLFLWVWVLWRIRTWSEIWGDQAMRQARHSQEEDAGGVTRPQTWLSRRW